MVVSDESTAGCHVHLAQRGGHAGWADTSDLRFEIPRLACSGGCDGYASLRFRMSMIVLAIL